MLEHGRIKHLCRLARPEPFSVPRIDERTLCFGAQLLNRSTVVLYAQNQALHYEHDREDPT
jgi:hypothetical protein